MALIRSLRVSIAGLLALLAGCGDSPSVGRTVDGRPVVLTTTWPLADLAARLAPGLVEVGCVVPPGRDVRTWRPSREDLVALGDAALVVLNGAGLETWLRRANLPRARVVDTSAGFADRYIETESEVSHSHGDGDQHSHTGTDPHVWLDPELHALQARALSEALQRLLPDHAEAIEAHLRALLVELAALGGALRTLPTPDDGEVVVASHPTWAYLARRANLPVVEVDLDPRAVDAAEVATRLRDALGDRRVAAVLWEREPGQDLRNAVFEATGARSVILDPQVVRVDLSADAGIIPALSAGIPELNRALSD